MQSHLWRPYTQMQTALAPLWAVRTSGLDITLDDGRVLLDGIASWWTACHGYNHPHIAESVRVQLARMPHIMFGGLTHDPAEELAARLAALLPGDLDYVFFADSGSVAVEVAMKMAAQYWLNAGVRGRHKFVAFRGGYHGDTLATMSVCDPDEGMHALFGDLLPRQIIADLPRDDAAELVLDQIFSMRGAEIAAILVEPLVQGAGGMVFYPPDVLKRLRRLADKHGLLLIFDEIFTGFGRTGTMFAADAAAVVPDIMTLSKALTGGTMALSATVARRHVFNRFLSGNPQHALMHGPTYMANPLACSAALASLELFETEPRLQQVAQISSWLSQALAPCRELAAVCDVRVMGAIGVVQLLPMPDLNGLKQRLAAAGVWVRPFRDIVYLTPAFMATEEQIHRLGKAIFCSLAGGGPI
jgi:adenosylmethionine-8-amino-7-oxononanoate aminotransferase